MAGTFLMELEDTEYRCKIQAHMAALGITDPQEYLIEQYRENREGKEHNYHIFKLSRKQKEYLLKKLSSEEVRVYNDMLKKHSISVPCKDNLLQDKEGDNWILMEYIPGVDIRKYHEDLAFCAEKSVGEKQDYGTSYPSKSIDKKEFTDALLRFVEEAQTQKNVVTAEKVEQYFKALGVGKENLESVYSYLTEAGIRIEGTIIKFPETRSEEIQAKEETKKDSFFKMYLEDLSEIPEYGQEEEEALIADAMKGDKAAREHLIEGNLKFVLQLAEEKSRDSDVFSDVLQEGNIGLMQAVSDLSNRRKGQLFRDFARTYVEDAITGYLEDQVGSERIKRHLVEEVNRLDEAVRMLHEELGREATAKELSGYLNMEEEEIMHLIKISHNAVKVKEH